MSGIDNWTEAERQLYAVGSRAALDALARQQEDWRESWPLDTTATDAVVREHNAKMRQLEESHKAWLARYLGGLYDDGDEGPQDSQQGPRGASGGGPAPVTPPAVPAGQPNHAAELAEAERLRHMDMATYARERQRLLGRTR